MAPLSTWLVPLGILSLSQQPALVNAQFVQGTTSGYVASPTGGAAIQVPQWRKTVNDQLQRIIDISPDLVVLEYNCYYMKDICKNADNWMNTPRGQSRVPRNRFVYDFHTGKGNTWRNQQRRTASCGRWNSNTMCPHNDQGIVMRHDGPWQYKELEPGTTIAEIKAKRDANNNKIPSWVRYTCDEFPPATWIEGGNGSPAPEAQPQISETRCAAFRCNGRFTFLGLRIKVKAEQNWQATAHDVLQRALKGIISRRLAEFPWYQAKNSLAFFEFRYNLLSTNRNGIAASVTTFTPGWANVVKGITQAKRDILSTRNGTSEEEMTHEERTALHQEAFWIWADTVTVEELKSFGPLSFHEEHVLANHTAAAEQMMPQMPGMTDMPWMNYATTDEETDVEAHDILPDVVTGPPIAHPNKYKRADVPSNGTYTNTSSTALSRAKKIVEEAIANATKLNEARYAKPARNRYWLKPGTIFKRDGMAADSLDLPPPLLNITDEIADAAALVAEAEAGLVTNETLADTEKRRRAAAASGTYWMEHIQRMGASPLGSDSSYKIFRNVMDYGAKGDNVADDTKAIKLAMTDGKRCAEKCNGSTLKNAIVYFPPGTYRVSSSIPMPFGTQVIGDAASPPTIVATKSFIGLGVLSANEYTGGGKGADGLDQEYFINTANFYRQIRNIKIDITQTRPVQGVAGLHWQVAQATSLQNVELIALTGSGSKQRGIFAENGSGGSISDVTFRGGQFGLYGGSQQFTAQRLTFIGCETGVQVIWDWGWIWKSITMTDVGTGFRLLQESKTTTKRKRQTVPGQGSADGNIGSATFLDSTFNNVGTAVLIAPPKDKAGSGSTGVIIDNVAVSGVSKVVADTGGTTLLAPSGPSIKRWVLGPVYQEKGPDFVLGRKIDNEYRRVPELLDNKGQYFERPRPTYQDRPVGDFVHAKDLGCKGDGKTDDTAALQNALYSSLGKVLFIDAGTYVLTGTVIIPTGTKIVGETWSQLMASGSYFGDAKNPKVMLQVGSTGDTGDVEMQDLLFTSRGNTPGLVLVEWNIRGTSPGSAAMWDCHARLGGATGTDLTPAECPALTSGIAQGCNAASLMMHITPQASGYFENVWLWGSDHMIDDPDLNDANNTMVQNSIYVARGFLIESTVATWLYGTASEHAVMYQYNFNNAQNLFAGMIQTESPYFQPTPKPPAPFTDAVGVFKSDPSYANCTGGKEDELGGCDESWAVIMKGCANIMVAGAGLYSWFSTYGQDCIDTHSCQKALMLLEDNHSGVRFQQLITIGGKYVAVMGGKGIPAIDYLNVETHPRWSQVSLLDVHSDGALAQMFHVHPKIWDQEAPKITCVPPCKVSLPPWTAATRTVNYPLITVTDGDWKTTITNKPLTMTNMLFEPITFTPKAGNQKRADGDSTTFWPKPAKLARWPAVTYRDKDGNVKFATPTVTFPDPPVTVGPGATPPAGGSYPKREITLTVGQFDDPEIQNDIWEFCAYIDGKLSCPSWMDPELYGNPNGTGSQPPLDPDVPDNDDNVDEDYGDLDIVCPRECDGSHKQILGNALCPRDETSTTTTTTTTPSPTPTYAVGDPSTNTRNCYNSGQKATNGQMAGTAGSFCGRVASGKEGTVIVAEKGSGGKMVLSTNDELPANGQWPIHIQGEFFIKEGCKFVYSKDLCLRYMKVVIDSCNCEGADGKQGGVMDNNCYRFRLDPNTFG